MLSTQHLGIEVAIPFCGDGLCVCLTADLDALAIGEGNVFGNEGVVEGVEVESGVGH